MNELNNKLVSAFINQNYCECKELIEQGADSKVIIEQAKKIGGRHLTMSQDRIIRELA